MDTNKLLDTLDELSKIDTKGKLNSTIVDNIKKSILDIKQLVSTETLELEKDIKIMEQILKTTPFTGSMKSKDILRMIYNDVDPEATDPKYASKRYDTDS